MKSLDKTILLRISECDVNNRWRPGAILIEMQEIAGEQCARIGCGREDLLKMGLAWVVARMELQMFRYPTWGEQITLRTFHRPTRHRFFPRYFQMWDASGALIGQASSLWLLMDLETRQSVPADRLPAPLPDNSDLEEPMPLPKGIEQLDTSERIIPYSAVYTDLDANGHVNNTKYTDWLCNALGIETMASHPLRSVNIHFNSELLPERPIELHLRQDGLRYQLTGICDGRAAFEMGGTLMDIVPD